MANDGTVKIGTELDDSGFKSGLSKLGSIASGALKGGAAVIGGIATAAAGATAGLLALESATEEYRIAQGKLNTAYEAAGFSADAAQEAYKGFYEILGDTDTATEASQLLAKLAQSESEIVDWTDIAAGVYGTFGDSLPIEGLIEASNETAKVGEVTGVLADALNWAGISEDEFNDKLASCSDESERNKLIMETLSGTYDKAASAFYQNNEALWKARDAQIQMDESLATLGETVSRLKNNLISEFLPGISDVTTAFSGMLSGVEGADEQFTNAIASLVSTLMEHLPEFLNFGVQILTALLQGIVQSIPTLVSAVPQILQSFFTAFQEMLPTLMQVGSTILSQIAQGILTGLPMLAESAISLMTSFGQYIQANLPTLIATAAQFVLSFSGSLRENAGLLVDGALGLIESLAQGLISSLPTLIETIPEIVTNIAGIINDNAPKLIETAIYLIGQLAIGLIQAIPTLIANIPQIIQAIVAAFTAFNWLSLGKTIITGIKNGITSMIGAVKTAGKNVLDAIVNAIKSAPQKLLNLGKQGIQGLINGLKSLLGSIGSAMVSIGNAIINGVKSLPSKLLSIGKNIIQGLINGIKSGVAAVGSAISDLANSAVKKAKAALGIKSPSRVFRDQIGKNIGLGLAAGIDASKDDATKAADELAKSVYTASKEWLDKQVKYNEYSLRDQLEVWNAIQSQFIESSQQYADAEEQILDVRQKILDENISLEEDYQKQLSDLTKDIFDSYKLFAEVPEAQEVAGQDLIDNLRNQVDSIEAFYAGLDELYERGVGMDLVDEIRDMGIDAADELNALLALSDEQLTEYADLFYEKQKLANDLAVEELAGLRKLTDDEITANLNAIAGRFDEDAPAVGQALTDGLADGITSGQATVITAAVGTAMAAITAAKSALGVHSPSTVFEGIGDNVAQGLANGIAYGESRVKAAADELAKSIPAVQMGVTYANASMAPVSAPRFGTENALTQAAGMLALSQAGNNREIVLQISGREFARLMIPDIRAAESQSPAIVYS